MSQLNYHVQPTPSDSPFYSISSCDVKELCTVNASAAALAGRMDLVQVWSVAALVADIDIEVPPTPDDGIPWPEHPFGRELIHSL